MRTYLLTEDQMLALIRVYYTFKANACYMDPDSGFYRKQLEACDDFKKIVMNFDETD